MEIEKGISLPSKKTAPSKTSLRPHVSQSMYEVEAQLKKQRIIKIKMENDYRKGLLIDKHKARTRMVGVCQVLSGMISIGAARASLKIVGQTNAKVIESVLLSEWSNAITML